MRKHNVSFAGMRHNHVLSLYKQFLGREDVTICGAYENDAEAREKASASGVVFNYESLDELLNDSSVETVVIGDYYAARGGTAIRALQAGKNVLADKPLCTRSDELEEIRRLAAEKNLCVGILLSLRNSGNVKAVLESVHNGEIGKINNIIFEGQHPLNYGERPGWYFQKGCHGGVITDIAVHGIDLVRLFTGSNVKKVDAARCWNFYADKVPDFKDSAQFMLELESGAGVIADVSYAAPKAHGFSHPSYWHFRIFGDKGMLDFKADNSIVDLYLSDCSEKLMMEAEYDGSGEADEFFDAVDNEEKRSGYTEYILESMKQTIMIQEFADKGEIAE